MEYKYLLKSEALSKSEVAKAEHSSGADPGGGMGGSCPPLSKWSMTSCAYNCQPLLCFSLANTHTSRMPPLVSASIGY